ncbi:MAG: DUF5689 domain-containing protein [Prevotella sp.]|nr:DUF5689 domain-containing protein [Prevotella sp.]
MKTLKYFALLAFALTLAACQGDWDEPSLSEPPYGNSSIDDQNIISIKELIARYPNVFASTDQNQQITEDIKIRGRVTGNDLGSNIYKQFMLQDETGAIIVAVNQSGMHGFLAEGQEIVIALKDLYIGGYRKQPEIGQPYNGTSIGRMNKDVFQQHYKYVGTPDANAIQPIEFDVNMSKEENSAKLVTLKNVSFTPVAGLGTFAPDTTADKTVQLVGGCVNRTLNEYSASKVVIRTSTYAKFAARKLPYDDVNKRPIKCNITGIATRYNDTWQILIRKESDIEVLE